MEPNSRRWTTVSGSAFDHEREALACLRSELNDKRAVPVLSGNEWARIPDSWLKNTHRAVASKGHTP